jgi:hypothetical protein
MCGGKARSLSPFFLNNSFALDPPIATACLIPIVHAGAPFWF